MLPTMLRCAALRPQVCCSSPERFLRMGRGGVLEAKPIKGTAARSKDPGADVAAAAELAGKRTGPGLGAETNHSHLPAIFGQMCGLDLSVGAPHSPCFAPIATYCACQL